MSLPNAQDIYDVIEKTWPPAGRQTLGGWVIRSGQGGGKRVSAATCDAPGLPDIALAETAMETLDQAPLFMIREGEATLDKALQARGYSVIDPTTMYACPIDLLTATQPPPMTGFAIWPPLAIARDLWAAGGIGPARVAVMERVTVPKVSLLARAKDRAAGVAFVAIQRKTAMIHALEVAPTLRRNGVAINIMRHAAIWAQNQGATYFSLVVTDANLAANALYSKLGMTVVGHYHYRIRGKNDGPRQ